MDTTGSIVRRIIIMATISVSASVIGAEPVLVRPQDLLKETFTASMTNCSGWGKWDAPPSVTANSGVDPVTFPNGIKIPARSVIMHPGTEVDAAVGWKSPAAGKVSIRAKVTHAHPAGGDGVSWKLVHVGAMGRKALATGEIERGGTQVVAAADGKPAVVTVQAGDFLLLQIGRRGDYEYDSTLVDLSITEEGTAGRVWDLAKDVAANIQAGNPHADSLGNAAVWHFLLAPAASSEFGIAMPRAVPGQRLEAWTIATEDTKLTVGATDEGQLCLYELSNPSDGWNWTREPSVFPLVGRATVGNETKELVWKFKDGTTDKTNGQQVVVRFVCADPSLEVRSTWSAKPGRGPVRHTLQFVNRSNKPVILFSQPWMFLEVAGPAADGALALWTFHSGGGTPDGKGVYRETLGTAARQIETHPEKGLFIPFSLLDGGGKHGVYVGMEWSVCRMAAVAPEGRPAGAARVLGGEKEGFEMAIASGETLETPSALLGAYRGDVDDAGNSLRRFLFNYAMPEIVGKDATYPKVQWNAFGASGDKPGSWNCQEKKFYALVDDMAPLGFEEVMIDVGWWQGGTQAPAPDFDPVDWPSGMAKAAAHAHKAGLRFGLYWNKGEDMASAEGRNRRLTHIKRLYQEHHADMWRSDNTAGPVIGETYDQVKGFYALLDQMAQEIPNFQWENCCSGGRIKDFGAMKRAVKIFITDTYADLHVRQAFHDSSFVLPPAQLEGCLGSTDGRYRPQGAAGMRSAFRSVSMGAPEWFIDAPNGGNGSAPWTDEEKAAVKAAVDTYKAKIRPLVRNADLYHILPRPDGNNWDGIQYYDPVAKKGVVYLFKPAAGTDTMTIPLRGVEPKTTYSVTFEDGTNPAIEKTGEDLAKGLAITLKGAPVSELVFLGRVAQ